MWIFIWIKRRLKPLPFTEIKTLIIDWRDSNVSRHFYYLCYSKFCSGFPSSGLHQIWILSADMSVSLTTLNKTFSLMLFYCFLFLLWIAVEFCEYFFFFSWDWTATRRCQEMEDQDYLWTSLWHTELFII